MTDAAFIANGDEKVACYQTSVALERHDFVARLQHIVGRWHVVDSRSILADRYLRVGWKMSDWVNLDQTKDLDLLSSFYFDFRWWKID